MYGYNGTMRTTSGHRDDVIDILLDASGGLRGAGCLLCVVSTTDDDPDLIIVHEVWEGSERHLASLQLPAVQDAIAKARPMLTGEFTSQETTVAGGLGIDAGRD